MSDTTVHAADAIIHICRFASRITEWATHDTVGEYPDGTPQLDFDPIVLSVVDEEMPGAIDGDSADAVKATFPNYTIAFAKALAAYEEVLKIRKEAPPEYWQWAYPRMTPWTHEGTVKMKDRLDKALSELFFRARRLYEVNATL